MTPTPKKITFNMASTDINIGNRGDMDTFIIQSPLLSDRINNDDIQIKNPLDYKNYQEYKADIAEK